MALHIICTNYEGMLNLYHGPDLGQLIQEVLSSEYDISGFEDPEELASVVTDCMHNPNLDELTVALHDIDVDLVYSVAE